MAHSRCIINASPLILLGKTEQLGLLVALADQIAVPRAVVAEVGAKADGDRILQTVRTSASFVIVDDETPPVDILGWDLGAGETQVITGAIVHAADRVVIDELEARRCAKAMGLAVIGTLGVVGRAKAFG